MKSLETLEATFQIVTPMFLGDANQRPDDGIRPPSIKGALRFWWRALNWGRLRTECSSDEEALQLLHRQESALFGHAAEEDKNRPSGQARVLLQVVSDETQSGLPQWTQDGHKYLLGQGLYDQQRRQYQQQRGAPLFGTFKVRLRFHPKTDDEMRRQVVHALFAWGLLGGLGSRSRRGIGSVAIESVTDAGHLPPIPVSVDEYATALKWLGLPVDCALPPYTAFSAHSRMDCSVSGNADAWELLDEVGLKLMRYRGWGFDPGTGVHKVAGEPAEQNFPVDHDEMLGAVKGRAPSLLPCRAVFGLPHNYFFKSEFERLKTEKKDELMRSTPAIAETDAERRAKGWAGARSKAELAPATEHQTRRASPLLIHTHRFPDGNTAIIQTLLPAQFLPPNEEVLVKAKRLPDGQARVPVRADWDVIHAYLECFAGRTSLLTGRAVP